MPLNDTDTLHITIDTPDGRIEWCAPVTPLPGQPASYLLQKLKEIEAHIDLRNHHTFSQRRVVSFLERRTLASWQQAYQRSLSRECRMEAILEKHSKTG